MVDLGILSLNSRNMARGCFYWKFINLTLIKCLFTGVLFLSLTFFITGCGTSKAVKQAQQSVRQAYEMQKPLTVKTSLNDGRPKWIHNAYFEDDQNIYFTGGYMNGADYSLTIRLATTDAVEYAMNSIGQFIRTEFSSYVQGSNVSGDPLSRYVVDGLAGFTRGLHVSGFKRNAVYYEENFNPNVMKPSYNAWVQLQISRPEYLKAKSDALRQVRDRFKKDGEVEAKKKAEQLLEDLKLEAANGT